MEHGSYESELATRYASGEMCRLFSQVHRVRTWRALWIALAKAERELGLPITAEQIEELERQADSIDFAAAARREEVCRHEVMAHIYAYGLACPKARGILHLGATSCYVGDNTDVILMREGLLLVRDKLVRVLAHLGKFAAEYKDMPTLGYTHYQTAQMVTVGKRATLWMNELLQDLDEVEYRLACWAARGPPGPRPVFWNCSAGTGRRSGNWTGRSRWKWALLPIRSSRWQGRLTAGRWMLPFWPRCPASPSRPTSLPRTCACCAT